APGHGSLDRDNRTSRGRRLYRPRDPVIAGAAAEVAHHPVADLVFGRTGACRQQRGRRDELAGRADAALEAALADERRLKRRQLVALREPLDGDDGAAVGEHGGQEAGGQELAVDEHAARAADPDRAALFRSGAAEVVSQNVDEPSIGAYLERSRRAIQSEAQTMRAQKNEYMTQRCASLRGLPRSVIATSRSTSPASPSRNAAAGWSRRSQRGFCMTSLVRRSCSASAAHCARCRSSRSGCSRARSRTG